MVSATFARCGTPVRHRALIVYGIGMLNIAVEQLSGLHCEPDGQTLIANAGHLSPWRNAAELPIADPGLPLGVAPGLDWPDTTFHLAPGDQLTCSPTGVVEASNPRGELLGFARTGSLTTQTAAQIAATARDWGQNDDITAVTIRRTAMANTALA